MNNMTNKTKIILSIILFILVVLAGSYGYSYFTGGNFLGIHQFYREESTAPAKNIGQTDVANSPYFPALDFYNMQSKDGLTLLTNFKTSQQVTAYTCGPAAAHMVVEYLNGKPLHTELEMAQIMGTNNKTGTNTKEMVKYFKHIKWQVKSSADSKSPATYEDFLKFVQNNLKDNTPIIVENVDWGGHWRVIIGLDNMGSKHAGDDVLIMADPFDTTDHKQDGYSVVPAERFYYMWFDAQLFKSGENQKQWVIAKPK